MKITENLKDKVKKAEKRGVTHVSSICSNEYTTNYCHFISTKDILKAQVGDSLSFGRFGGITYKMYQKRHPKGVALGYRDLF